MDIVISANDNSITIDGKTEGCYYPVRLAHHIKNIFDTLYDKYQVPLNINVNITLTLINEDKRKLIGEW